MVLAPKEQALIIYKAPQSCYDMSTQCAQCILRSASCQNTRVNDYEHDAKRALAKQWLLANCTQAELLEVLL